MRRHLTKLRAKVIELLLMTLWRKLEALLLEASCRAAISGQCLRQGSDIVERLSKCTDRPTLWIYPARASCDYEVTVGKETIAIDAVRSIDDQQEHNRARFMVGEIRRALGEFRRAGALVCDPGTIVVVSTDTEIGIGARMAAYFGETEFVEVTFIEQRE